jgi:NADPH:quinone reductase-like Zn-dependent oxidoreductase
VQRAGAAGQLSFSQRPPVAIALQVYVPNSERAADLLGAQNYIDTTEGDPAEALRKLGDARRILATVTSAEAMQSVVGGLGPNGTMMIIGVVAAVPINPIDMIGKSSAVRGWYSGVAADSEDTRSPLALIQNTCGSASAPVADIGDLDRFVRDGPRADSLTTADH